MAYDEELADRVRGVLAGTPNVEEKLMFGGVCVMVNDTMVCGVNKTDLMVRLDPATQDAVLALPGARPMDFTHRPMRGFVFVGPDGTDDDASLHAWVQRGLDYAAVAPAKKKRKKA